ncbi:MAG: ATP-binding protein [Xanthomonadales bacterium]|nr:ATP-binding protein [Xanthomonadales bacterium]
MSTVFFPRLLQPRLETALEDTPVVLIHGPRQCGKTTLAQVVAELKGYEYLTFDDINLVEAARADPVGFIDRLGSKIVLDEVQHVPELFRSIKLAVDTQRIPGQFLLTGSANVLLLPQLSESLAGRIEILPMLPLARCEVETRNAGLLEYLLKRNFNIQSEGRLGARLEKIVTLGGYPEPLMRKNTQRRLRWHQNYIETIVQRDIRELARISNLEAIPRILELAALQSGQLLNMSRIAAPFKLSRPTVAAYFSLLQNVFLLDVLPAWHGNRGKRLIKTPKVHMVDTGLAAALLGANEKSLSGNRKLLGQLLESFVYNELQRQASALDSDLSFYHFRDKDQYEVDIVIEQPGVGLMGIEVKASATVRESDFRGLKRLKVTAGAEFNLGVILYDGDRVLAFGENLLALPISTLWGTVGASV